MLTVFRQSSAALHQSFAHGIYLHFRNSKNETIKNKAYKKGWRIEKNRGFSNRAKKTIRQFSH